MNTLLIFLLLATDVACPQSVAVPSGTVFPPYNNSLFIDPEMDGYLGPNYSYAYTGIERAKQTIVP